MGKKPTARSDHLVEADGAELVASVDGTGGDAVLVHAGVADRRAWYPLMDELSDRWRLIAYDGRGFGDTMYRTGIHDPRGDLAEVVAQLATAPVAIVGNSQGGALAIDVALWRPELVRRLVLIGSAVRGAPPPDDVPEAIITLDTRIDEAWEAGDVDGANRMEAHMWLDGPLASEGRVTGALRDLFLDMNGIALRAPEVGASVPIPDAWDRLEQITAPTLVISGSLDLPHFRDRQAALVERIPDARLEVIDDVAHLPALEAPESVARLIDSFLSA